MENHRAQESEIKKELDRRLDLVLQDGYGDPAREDISRWELVVWFGFAVLIAAVTAAIRTGI